MERSDSRLDFARAGLLAVVGAIALSPGVAFGAHKPKTVSLDGGSVWTATPNNCSSGCGSKEGDAATVCPGEGISVAFTVQISSSTSWNYTGYKVEGYSEVCVDTPNHSSNSTYTRPSTSLLRWFPAPTT